MAVRQLEAQPFMVERDGQELDGEAVGKGPAIVLLHGITASRRYVVHGSKVLPRAGHRTVYYDARGHGESGPAPQGSGYTYRELVPDLAAVIDAQAADGRPVIAGHSMGAHTVVAYALEYAERLAGMVVIGPSSSPTASSRTGWRDS
jgi:3-oxoadipate enol-lactonase